MKNCILITVIVLSVFGCANRYNSKAKSEVNSHTLENDTIRISNESSDYDVIIIEQGFSFWLKGHAKPKSYYTKSYLENKNKQYVTEWNRRVLDGQRYNPNLYELQINYYPDVDYGLDVNYQLYNYFIFFQNKYKQNLLGGIVPTN